MIEKINRQIQRNNINRLIYLSLTIIYISIFFLLTTDVINFTNNVWEKFPSQYYVFLNHLLSIPVMLLLLLINRRYLKKENLFLNYPTILFINIALSAPILLVYYYWEVVDYFASGVFIIYILTLGFVIRENLIRNILLLLYFTFFYFGILVFLKVNYTTNPSIYINGIATVLIYFFISKNLYDLEYRSVKNRIEVKENNKTLARLNNKLTKSLAKEEKINTELYNKNKEIEKLLNINERVLFNKVLKITSYKDKITTIINKIATVYSGVVENSVPFNKITRSLQEIISEKDVWRDFEAEFEKIHPNFLNKLKSLNKNLTNNDLKHCAYVISNLSSKDVASLVNISFRSVETTRYRIKKKLNIEKGIGLYEFLYAIKLEETKLVH